MKHVYNKNFFDKRQEEIARLHNRINETLKRRSESKELHREWEIACAEFHNKYAELAFFDGIEDYREEIRSGNKKAIEYYISFIEARPYFFRSGYIYQDLIRVLKNCDLTSGQRERYERVRERYDQVKKRRKDRNQKILPISQ